MSFIDHFSIIEDPRKDIEDFGHDKLDWLRSHRPYRVG